MRPPSYEYVNEERIEALVLQTALARNLLSAKQVAAARAAHAGASSRGTSSNLMIHLSDQLDPSTRAEVRKIYHQAIRSESTSGSGSGTTRMDPQDKTIRVDPDMTYMEVPPASGSGTTHAGQTFAPPGPAASADSPPVGLGTTRGPGTSDLGSGLADTVLAPGATVDMASATESGSSVHSVPGYTVVGELGRGGMGVVYRAVSEAKGSTVAIKVLLAGSGAKPEDVRRFQTEAKAAACLRHPHIVPLLEHGEVAGNPFMVLGFVEGQDLDKRIKAAGRVDPEDAVEIAIGIADALAFAHEQGILHRDLKPQNVLLDAEGQPLLTDFGLAKLRGDSAPSVSLTQSGMLLGTPAYMAPEQAAANRHAIDERTDVYGLGATLFHMLTGTRPFSGETLASLILKILNDAPPEPSSLVPELDSDLETIVLKCLEKDREDRYPSAEHLLRDLTRWQKNLAIVAARPSLVTRAQRAARRNPTATSVAGIASLVLLIALGLGYRSMRNQAALQAQLDAMQQSGNGSFSESVQESSPERQAPEPEKTVEPPPPEGPPPPPPEKDPVADPRPKGPPPAQPPVSDPHPKGPPPAQPPVSDPHPKGPPKAKPPSSEALHPTEDPKPPGEGPDHEPEHAPVEPAPPVDPSGPDATPPEPTPPVELVLHAALPPGWVVERLDRLKALPTPAYTRSWQEAERESRAFNVPIAVLVLGPKAKKPSSYSYLKVLDQLAVTVIARGPHPPTGRTGPPDALPRGGPPRGPRGGPPGGRPNGGMRPQPQDPSAPCPVHETLTCGDHQRLAGRVLADVPFSEDALRVAIYSPQGDFHALGAKRGGDFKLSTTGLKASLAALQAQLGAPAVPPTALLKQGPKLRALDESRRPLGAPYVDYAQAPEPLGAWARFRARERCEADIRRAMDRGQLRGKLRELRADYADEPGCAGLLDAAAQTLD